MVELFAQLCQFHNLNPLTDITSHYEGYEKGYASNHGDPRHLWNGLGMDYNMDKFRQEVKERLDELNGDEDMTQDKFNEMMDNYLASRSKEEPESWSVNERTWAESNKILQGDEKGNANYKSWCTREEMVVFLKRLNDLLDK